MSIDAHCHHRCSVDRPVHGRDGYGNAATTYTEHLTGVACRLVVKQQRVADSAIAERPVVTTYLLIVAGNADLRQGDRVRAVVDRAGATVDVGPFRISAALPRRAETVHHRSYQLERQGGPDA